MITYLQRLLGPLGGYRLEIDREGRALSSLPRAAAGGCGREGKEEGIWLLASSLEDLQGLPGPSPGAELPLGPFQLQ